MNFYLKVILSVWFYMMMTAGFSPDACWAGTDNKALSVPVVAMGNDQQLGTLQIIESEIGGLIEGDENNNTITLTLPEGVTFSYITAIQAGGWSEGDWEMAKEPTINSSGYSEWVLWLANPSESKIGVIRITMVVNIDATAQKGDISCTVSGTNPYVTASTVVVGRYGKYGVTGTCSKPTSIYAGRCDAKIGALVLHENLPGTLIKDRTVNLELPAGCRWVSIPELATTSSIILSNGSYMDGTDYRVVSYKVERPSTLTNGDIEFRQGSVSVPAGFAAGDLNVSFSGTGGAVAEDSSRVSSKVATIITPVTLTGTNPIPNVMSGNLSQYAGSFNIVEAGPGAIVTRIGDIENRVMIKAPPGVRFAGVPKISVTGDLKLDLTNVGLTGDDRYMTIPVTRSSIKTASTIAVKNVKFTLERTVPEGPLKLAVTGPSVDWWPDWYANWEVGRQKFDYSNVVEGQVANVTIPVRPTVFTIGSTSYKLYGVDKTMDCAPYIKDDRTFLPVLYVGYVMGLSDSEIFWNEDSQTVTLIKDNKVLQLTVGSKTMLINGLPVTLGAAPEVIPPGRTCLPIALIQYAIEGDISWDPTTQTITIVAKSQK